MENNPNAQRNILIIMCLSVVILVLIWIGYYSLHEPAITGFIVLSCITGLSFIASLIRFCLLNFNENQKQTEIDYVPLETTAIVPPTETNTFELVPIYIQTYRPPNIQI